MITTQVQIHTSFQAVLNCFLRESSDWSLQTVTALGPQSFLDAGLEQYAWISLPEQGVEYAAGIEYYSPTLRHRIHFPVLRRDTSDGVWYEADIESFVRESLGAAAQKLNVSLNAAPDALLDKIRNSAENIERFVTERAGDVEDLNSARPQRFIESEQALILGHQTHPGAKSREGFTDAEMLLYSPELRGEFPLHFFHVHPDVLHSDSAVPGRSARDIIFNMLKSDETVSPAFLARCEAKPDWALLPVHPWQAQFAYSLAEVRDLFQRGLLEDLGPAGAAFTPTTSIRTVYREGCEFMFKFSLSVKITNSVRVSLSRELDRSVEMARLMQTEYGREIQADVPDFGFIQDPAYISVKVGDRVVEALSCTFREAALVDGPRDVSAITCLVQDHAFGAKNRLYRIIENIARREKRSVTEAARDWFSTYLRVSIYNLLKLYFKWGLCFEAHGQNSLLELENGYPVRYLYRDSQGYFHRAAAHADFHKVFPHLGEVTESIFPEDLADERLVYYLIVNQVFSVINAFGMQGLADENDLLREFAELLDRVEVDGARYPTRMLDNLRNLDRLPCKGNLFTQFFNMDELVGDIATQSVYVTIPNVIKAAVQEARS